MKYYYGFDANLVSSTSLKNTELFDNPQQPIKIPTQLGGMVQPSNIEQFLS